MFIGLFLCRAAHQSAPKRRIPHGLAGSTGWHTGEYRSRPCPTSGSIDEYWATG